MQHCLGPLVNRAGMQHSPICAVHRLQSHTSSAPSSVLVQESYQSKRDRVEQLLSTLTLQGCRNTCIGDTLARGISGGQAKRTNVGIALITNPKVLFLDGMEELRFYPLNKSRLQADFLLAL